MLISRDDLRFDYRGAQFDLTQAADRKFLGWVFNQFLYGEVTGIQCGFWLYRAPHLNAATFLARQAQEELSHVRRILRILQVLGEAPQPPHPWIRFLASGQVGGSHGDDWGAHVALEMALGEGLVLGIFYAMAETIADPEIKKILEMSSLEEEKHVEFGERETLAWLAQYPGDAPRLARQAFLQSWAMRRFRSNLLKKLSSEMPQGHPVLGQFYKFYDHLLDGFENRARHLKLVKKPLREFTAFEKLLCFSALPWDWLRAKFRPKRALLTETYLNDPLVLSIQEKT